MSIINQFQTVSETLLLNVAFFSRRRSGGCQSDTDIFLTYGGGGRWPKGRAFVGLQIPTPPSRNLKTHILRQGYIKTFHVICPSA